MKKLGKKMEKKFQTVQSFKQCACPCYNCLDQPGTGARPRMSVFLSTPGGTAMF